MKVVFVLLWKGGNAVFLKNSYVGFYVGLFANLIASC